MKLRARWDGPPPAVGDVLRSPFRPRRIYIITQVDIGATKDDATTLLLTVEARPAHTPWADLDLPPDARLHAWRWDPRTRKKMTP